ncbi:MAG TPA: hypothetical protein VFJ70_05685 [Burkholderiales bacterium]|nr:hypothetical protein [Burkholderiales bacterium]
MWRSISIAVALAFAAPALALADDDDGNGKLKAEPFVFIGDSGDCGTLATGEPSPAGSRIVTSAWLGGMGLPDDPTNPKRDPHTGLLLSKNGATADCSAAGAEIHGVKRMEVGATFVLGFDYRNGGHCGAGAPRFNVSYTAPDGSDGFSFVGGCANDTPTPAPQDPTEWTRVRFTAASQFPPIPPGSRIRSISIIYDEGTDSVSVEDPRGVGLAVIDNIFVNGETIARGHGIADK